MHAAIGRAELCPRISRVEFSRWLATSASSGVFEDRPDGHAIRRGMLFQLHGNPAPGTLKPVSWNEVSQSDLRCLFSEARLIFTTMRSSSRVLKLAVLIVTASST